ncbi:hypothetical protein TanjilG_01102 [Lupinus angustifolius]|uniref:Uncharacterized protein n=1 Tax=Lupinus angustifolius TaxID=3871 RepID=A0A1J7G635_LUPAN|nr:hypothetical protein TanjilG_01102 [Lupinus angustifolius]
MEKLYWRRRGILRSGFDFDKVLIASLSDMDFGFWRWIWMSRSPSSSRTEKLVSPSEGIVQITRDQLYDFDCIHTIL